MYQALVWDGVHRFSNFLLDPSLGELRNASGDVVRLRPKVLTLLEYLINQAGRVARRDAILDAVWPGLDVGDESLSQAVAELRQALGPEGFRLIRTVPRAGYILDTEVAKHRSALHARTSTPSEKRVIGPKAELAAATKAVSIAGAGVMQPHAMSAATSPTPRVLQTFSERPLLVVTPFSSLGNGRAERDIARGLTEDLLVALARARWFHVLSGESASSGGARYGLEGSVRRAGGKLRIVARLLDTETGRHVWADKFEGYAADPFTLQDAVAEALAGAVEPALERAEVERVRSRPVSMLDAHGLYFRSLPLRTSGTEAGSTAALGLLRSALALEPDFAAAKAAALICYNVRACQGWGDQGEREQAVVLARGAQAAHADDPLVLTGVTHVLGPIAHDITGALAAADAAVTQNPHSAWVENAAGWAGLWAGDTRAAMTHFRRAIRLSPYDIDAGYFHAGLAHVQLMSHCPAEAQLCAEAALRHNPSLADGHRARIVALHALGRRAEAASACRRYQAEVPTGASVDALAVQQSMRDEGFGEFLITALRVSGVPE